jgi:hypothetical protein
VAEQKTTIKDQANTIKRRDKKVIDLKNTLNGERESFGAAKEEIVALRQRLEDQETNMEALREETEELRNRSQSTEAKDNIIRILNGEINAHEDVNTRQRNGALDGMIQERIRIKSLKIACKRRHAALKVRYDNLRHKDVKLELPLDRVRVTADMKKQQTMVVKEMEGLIF